MSNDNGNDNGNEIKELTVKDLIDLLQTVPSDKKIKILIDGGQWFDHLQWVRLNNTHFNRDAVDGSVILGQKKY